jgi:hypothetical protein
MTPVTADARRELCAARLGMRERHSVMVEEAVTIWPRLAGGCDTCPPRRLPALQGDVFLAGPAAVRLRIRSSFGTAAELGLSGDSIVACAPAQGWAAALDASRDSLGLGHPGSLGIRVLSAVWFPPDTARVTTTREGEVAVRRWSEGGDSVALAANGAGDAAWARLWRRGAGGFQVGYDGWQTVDGVPWPARLRLQALDGAFDMTVRVDHVTVAERPDPARLAVRVPAGVERLGRDRLAAWLGQLGRGR